MPVPKADANYVPRFHNGSASGGASSVLDPDQRGAATNEHGIPLTPRPLLPNIVRQPV